ncbi:MAG: patatin-like phospholipase family protein [Holophagales bacterium]|nr:patatin-like phospholipase family protein [Holophagales bacterium]
MQEKVADRVAEDLPYCDVVMKGGITSGVVYPLAIRELTREFRLHNVGGTSAGAMAASVAAAAEYKRQKDGDENAFGVLDEIPDELSRNLSSMFQPSPRMRPMFEVLLGAQKGKTTLGRLGRAALAGVSANPLAIGAGVLAGLGLPRVALLLGVKVGSGVKTLLPVVGGGAGLSVPLLRAIGRELPAHGFGMCPGLTQPGYDKPAVTDWLADTIDRVAGRDVEGDPLTFGDLEQEGIHLRIMTTNLSMRRPYRLPLDTKIYRFRRSDFEKLFPKRVVEYLCRGREPRGGLYPFPGSGKDLPVVVAARMSLSFPGLISAVPLYAVDYTKKENRDHRKENRPPEWEVCWFSDGGLSSNFPIHLFDRVLPNTPTFGIALEPWRAGDELVWMPSTAGGGSLLRIYPIEGVGSFVMTLVTSASEWQDNLQSILPGYRERIVRVKLKEEEGGLNLDMPAPTIVALSQRGSEAGRKLREDFDLADHRWKRFLIAMANLEETLADLSTAYEEGSFRQFLGELEEGKANPSYYDPKKDRAWLGEAQARIDELAELGASERVFDPEERSIPKPETDFRIVPSDAG